MLGNILKTRKRHESSYNVTPTHVQGGLALTPSQMMTMSQAGVPISTQVLSAELFDPGHEGSSPDVPFERKRGVDFSSAYEYQERCRSKISGAIKSSES